MPFTLSNSILGDLLRIFFQCMTYWRTRWFVGIVFTLKKQGVANVTMSHGMSKNIEATKCRIQILNHNSNPEHESLEGTNSTIYIIQGTNSFLPPHNDVNEVRVHRWAFECSLPTHRTSRQCQHEMHLQDALFHSLPPSPSPTLHSTPSTIPPFPSTHFTISLCTCNSTHISPCPSSLIPISIA